jgi:hypothetical protein
MSKIMVRIPTHGPIDRGLATWFHWAGRVHPEWDLAYYYQTAGVCETRNEIVVQFLASDCDRLWMIDSDVTPPESDGILNVKGDVVAGLYGHYHPQVGANYQVYRKNPTEGEGSEMTKGAYRFYPPSEWPEDDNFRADAAGTGCMVINRSVLEKIREHGSIWFEFEYRDGRRIGEDLTFCEKSGGVTICPSYICSHAKEVDITELVRLTQFAAVGVAAIKSQGNGSTAGAPTNAPEVEDGDIPPPPPPLEEILKNLPPPPNRRERRKRNKRKK